MPTKASVFDILAMVTHSPSGSKPPMSSRVIALNSFVLPARRWVSVMLLDRVIALTDIILTDYLLFLLCIAILLQPDRDASDWAAKSANFRLPLLRGDVYRQVTARDRSPHLWSPERRTPESACSTAQ